MFTSETLCNRIYVKKKCFFGGIRNFISKLKLITERKSLFGTIQETTTNVNECPLFKYPWAYPYRITPFAHSRFCTLEFQRKVNKLNVGAQHEYRPRVNAKYFDDDLPLALDSDSDSDFGSSLFEFNFCGRRG